MDYAPRPLKLKTAHDGLIGRTRRFVLSLVAEIEERLPPGEGAIIPAALIRRLMRNWLIPAEAAMRRAILLIAASLPLPPLAALIPAAASAPAPPQASPRKSPEDGARKSSRTPVFSMKEPRRRSKADDTAADQLRRSLLQAAAMDRPCRPLAPLRPLRSPTEEAARLQERFLCRLDALAFAMGNPEREAERFLRRQEKEAEKHRQIGALPPLPISFQRPSGLGEETDPQFISLLIDLNAAVAPLFPARPNTS